MKNTLARLEKFVEDLVLIFVSVFTIILAITALTILSTGAPASVEARAETISLIAQASFLAKAEYFAALLMPWIVIIAVLVIARELWLMRRRMEMRYYASIVRRPVRVKRATKTKKRKK